MKPSTAATPHDTLTSAPRRQHRPVQHPWRSWVTGYLCILPAFVGLLCFALGPALVSCAISVFQWDLIAPRPTFVGLQNFLALWRNPTFWQVLRNTVVFSFGTTATLLVLAFAAALALSVPLRGVAAFRALVFVPYITPMAVIGILWLFLYDPQGIFNALLARIGIAGPPWLQSTTWALPALMLMKVWKSLGYFALLYVAGLTAIPRDVLDAARVDGANSWQRVRFVLLPLLAPVMVFISVVATIGAFQDFDQVAVMTRGGPVDSTNIVVYFLYQQTFENYQAGRGAALAVVLLVVLCALTFAQLQFAQRWTDA